jgi:hypothetical protein
MPGDVESVDRIPAPGNSQEQRDAEAVMVGALAEQLGVALAPRRIEFGNGVRVELDAASEDLSVLVEVWAHQGPVKSAQRSKVLTDAFKLDFVGRKLGGTRRLILLLGDAEAARKFAGGWPAAAIRQAGIEMVVLELDDETRQRVRDAQLRQYR